MTTNLPLTELARRLDALALTMAQLTRDYPTADQFWPAFAGVADEIRAGAGAEHQDYVLTRLEDMLIKHGWQDPNIRQT